MEFLRVWHRLHRLRRSSVPPSQLLLVLGPFRAALTQFLAALLGVVIARTRSLARTRSFNAPTLAVPVAPGICPNASTLAVPVPSI